MLRVVNDYPLIINEQIVKRIINHKILGKKFIARIVSCILNFDYEQVLNNIREHNKNIKLSDFSADYILNHNLHSNILIIDVRLGYGINDFYSFLYELNMDTFGFSNRKKKIIQIFIDSKDRFLKDKFLYNVICMEKNELISANKFFEKYYINLNYLRGLSQDTIIYEKNKLIRTMYFFVCDSKKIINLIYNNDDLIKKIIREMKKIALHEYVSLYFIATNHNIKYLYEEYFLNEVINYGFLEEKKRFIKSLYDNGATLDLIRRASDLEIDKVKEIIESM